MGKLKKTLDLSDWKGRKEPRVEWRDIKSVEAKARTSIRGKSEKKGN